MEDPSGNRGVFPFDTDTASGVVSPKARKWGYPFRSTAEHSLGTEGVNMRKLIASLATVCVVASLSGAALGGVAHAEGSGQNVIVGTPSGDFLTGTSGNDAIFGRQGADWIWGGKGRDELYGGRGRDQLRSADGRADAVYGGPGKHDQCVVDQRDFVRGCEQVTVLKVHGDDD